MRKKIIAKLDKIFSEFIRLRYADNNGNAECVTCGKIDNWKKLQCGHFQSRKHYSTRWHEDNCQVQCSGCNVFKYGEQYKFGLYLNAKYGEGYAEDLLILSKQILKISNTELVEMIENYENKVQKIRLKKKL